MEPNQIPQAVQQASQSSFYTKETDDLLKKYLKLQIGMFYWGIVSRIIFYILIIISIVTSVYTLGPLVEKLVGPLTTYQELLKGNTNLPTSNNSGQGLDLNAIIEQFQGN